jgi:vacuolar protein sorting-associated protein 11
VQTGGLLEHASYLARKYERHGEYLRIQIEDARNFGEALGYLRKLGAEAVSSTPFVSNWWNLNSVVGS